MPEEMAKKTLLKVLQHQPSLIFDVLAELQPVGDQPESPPTGPNNAPDWCVCTHCSIMPDDLQSLCCGMQPDYCLSLRPVCYYCMLTETRGVLEVIAHLLPP